MTRLNKRLHFIDDFRSTVIQTLLVQTLLNLNTAIQGKKLKIYCLCGGNWFCRLSTQNKLSFMIKRLM